MWGFPYGAVPTVTGSRKQSFGWRQGELPGGFPSLRTACRVLPLCSPSTGRGRSPPSAIAGLSCGSAGEYVGFKGTAVPGVSNVPSFVTGQGSHQLRQGEVGWGGENLSLPCAVLRFRFINCEI